MDLLRSFNIIAAGLGELVSDVVFVGGATTFFYVDSEIKVFLKSLGT